MKYILISLNKYIFYSALIFSVCVTSCELKKNPEFDANPPYLEPVSYQNVTITDEFWAPKIRRSRENGLKSVFDNSKSSIDNFAIAAGILAGEHNLRMASDSDVYKIIQGVAYALHHAADEALEVKTDELIEIIVAAQEMNGYLFTPYIGKDEEKRWTNIDKDHELYCAGHLFEAATAYYEVTGKRKLLDAAIKFADHIDSIFGPGKRVVVPGHQEIELALFKLYKVTGDEKYFKLSEFFIDERGNPDRIDTVPPQHDPHAGTPLRWRHPFYRQDHLPVPRQYHARGHAVRAMYMYSAMADLEMETGSKKYLPALDSIWNDIVGKKMFVTAGIGTHEFHDEGFGTPYRLPNDSSYSETCSGIGSTFFNRRMTLIHRDSKYADLVELLMYNVALSGVSLEGDTFFYRNLIESFGDYRRRPWFNPACCPSSVVRFLPEIGALIYAKDRQSIFINQFIGNSAHVDLADQEINLSMVTNYPWDGLVDIKVEPKSPTAFKLYIRIPGWVSGKFISGSDLYTFADRSGDAFPDAILKLNGKSIAKPIMLNGYAVIDRIWQEGDRVQLELPMKPKAVLGHPNIKSTTGMVAFSRGPMVYCLEEFDNPDYFSEENSYFAYKDSLTGEFDKNSLGGVVVIKGVAYSATKGSTNLTYSPYHTWANRSEGKMAVWVPYQ